MTQRIVIHVEGGLVVEVEKPSDLVAHVIDLDTEGADEDKLCRCEMAREPHFHTEHPSVLNLYRELADGLSDMVEGSRLQVGDIPDDYQWLVELLATIAGADPGPPLERRFRR